MTEQLQAILLQTERFAYASASQIEEVIYYYPAWSIISLMLLYHTIRWLFWSTSKKRFTPEKCTNIMITGGAQGLGKLLAEQFLRRNQVGSVNLIVVDIRDDLAPQLLKDAKAITGHVNFKNIHFYKANLADVAQTKETWQRIIDENGPIHILVNNHAICQGKRVAEHTIESFKLTMDINFNSFVQLTMLFLQQDQIKDSQEGERFHLVNVNSIAGHMTCQRNSDYSASKFALNGFTDALRQELEMSGSPVKMTNFYPYYINTGLFEGFKPTLRWILPTLKANKVTQRMHQAIMAEEKEVFIDSIIWWIKIALLLCPLSVRNWCVNILVGQGMEYFKGRQMSFNNEKKKNQKNQSPIKANSDN